jgi:hypothetical protein
MTTESTLTVSATTRNFIECLVMLDKLYSKVSYALSEQFGEAQADKIILEEYGQSSNDLRAIIKDFMCESIDESISFLDYTEI